MSEYAQYCVVCAAYMRFRLTFGVTQQRRKSLKLR